MVQFKRKPVKFEPLPPFLDDSTEIWVIEDTGEVFTAYEKYLARRDFYLQTLFTCESTGHTGYTFFEARESEMEASKEINSIFPEWLRRPVLEYVQFEHTPRMDDLVNRVFDEFQERFMVGDRVLVEHDTGKRYGVISNIQDTSRIHNLFNGQLADDQFRSETYYITLDDSGEQLIKSKASELKRDRKVYSKLVLKQFLRSAISREGWNGAPWKVKDHLAKRYQIDTQVPQAKTRDAVMAAKKAAHAAGAAHHLTHSGPPNNAPHAPHMSDALTFDGHVPMGHRPPFTGPGHPAFVNYSGNSQHPLSNEPGKAMIHHQNQPSEPHPPFPPMALLHGRGPPIPPMTHPLHLATALPPYLAQLAQHMPPPGSGLPISLPFQNNFMQYQTLAPTNLPQQQPAPLARPFEPVKYPTEDLRIKTPRTSPVRPPLKFFSDDVPEGAEAPEKKTGILMKSVGPLLCAWETLNVHDTIYVLDSFTLDDFVDAMRFSSEEEDCELLVELHCSVLKQIVNESGKLQVSIPNVEDSDDEENDEDSKTTSPEPEPEPPVRTTRSSLRKSEANSLAKQRTPTPEPPKQLHKAAEFLAEYDWIEQCKIRNFLYGGWQAILVGLLYALSFGPTQKDMCDEILADLVPADEEPTVETIARHYNDLDVNLRISALDMILRLTIVTDTFREQLVAASQEMTRLRKEKIEHQRKRKELAEELFKLDIERKIQHPFNMPASPTEKENQDLPMVDTEEGKFETDASESSEEAPRGNRNLRHKKQNKRKRGAEAVKKQKAKKAKVEAAKTKQQQEWEKLLKAIEDKKDELKECEANINELDDDLRETLVHRSKLIGKDRFLNKYYWFEHNGMPFGGVPTSSTADYGYANGRLWVQGPDEHELQPNLEEPALSQDMEDFGFTVPQRKEKEEGSTHLSNATEWGYYDDPEDLDKLLAWLDERGVREKALRKELQMFRERIAEYMLKMKAHLAETDKAKEEEETATRASTRTKTYVDRDVSQQRCLRWTNSVMLEDYGHKHSTEYDPNPPKRTKRGTAKSTRGRGRGRK